MLCLAPLPEGERTPLLTPLLVAEPHVVIPKGPKSKKGKVCLRNRDTSVTWSEETHASSVHEEDEIEVDDEENPHHKGKRVASEDAEACLRPKGSKRPRRTSARAAGKSSERVELSGNS